MQRAVAGSMWALLHGGEPGGAADVWLAQRDDLERPIERDVRLPADGALPAIASATAAASSVATASITASTHATAARSAVSATVAVLALQLRQLPRSRVAAARIAALDLHVHHPDAGALASAHLLHGRRAALRPHAAVQLHVADVRRCPIAACILRSRAAHLLDAHHRLKPVHVRLAASWRVLQWVHTCVVDQYDV